MIGYHGNQKTKFAKKYSKINSSETEWGIKLKLCRTVSNIDLYENIVFIAVAQALYLLWQACRFIAISLKIFWPKFCRNVCWVVLHQAYHFCSNLLIWLVAMATKRLHFRTKIFINQLLRSYEGDKAETTQSC